MVTITMPVIVVLPYDNDGLVPVTMAFFVAVSLMPISRFLTMRNAILQNNQRVILSSVLTN